MKFKIILLLCLALNFGCKKSETSADDTSAEETAQQIGDAMASVDEAGGSSGTIASTQAAVQKTFARLAPDEIPNRSLLSHILLPQAEATSCGDSGFSACSGSGVITRDFAGCTVGTAVFTGTVTLAWSNGSTCSMLSNGESLTRSPSFTVTGRRGATLAVSKTGSIGQKLYRDSDGVFSFTNDGINRKFTTADASVLFDQTTSVSVSSPITVTGGARSGRVMNGGTLHVVNNLTSVTCDYSPTNVTWSAGCNCPTSGSWTGTCSNSNTTTLSITGCGTATFTDGSFSSTVTLDRCGS